MCDAVLLLLSKPCLSSYASLCNSVRRYPMLHWCSVMVQCCAVFCYNNWLQDVVLVVTLQMRLQDGALLPALLQPLLLKRMSYSYVTPHCHTLLVAHLTLY